MMESIIGLILIVCGLVACYRNGYKKGVEDAHDHMMATIDECIHEALNEIENGQKTDSRKDSGV